MKFRLKHVEFKTCYEQFASKNKSKVGTQVAVGREYLFFHN